MRIDIDEYEVTYRQFDHWCRQKWIRSTGKGGSGIDRDFEEDEVKIFKIMAPLVKLGLSPRVAAALARTHVENGFTGALTLRDGELELSGIFASVRADAVTRRGGHPGEMFFR
jgi:hypothetical protein